jgi:hypothetical protein
MESNTSASNTFLWSDVDWTALRALRARFLDFDRGNDEPGDAQPPLDRSDYWQSFAAMASYDFTFAERIGWKWDTVIAELQTRGWAPPAGTFLDWGCGTGVAGRRVVTAWPDEARKLLLWDRSEPSRQFASKRARQTFPHHAISPAASEIIPDLLIISHVINELSPDTLEHLIALIERAPAVLWVEPGTSAVSHKLIAVRERLLGKTNIIAPCTHTQMCGMLAKGNERHWCHHFAKIPGYVHTDSGWGKFSKTLDIDISTLPFSYLVLDGRPVAATPEPESSRVIGVPRYYKGFSKILSCQADGVHELTLQKRDAPDLLKAMKKDPGSHYQWDRDGDKIRGGTRLF